RGERYKRHPRGPSNQNLVVARPPELADPLAPSVRNNVCYGSIATECALRGMSVHHPVADIKADIVDRRSVPEADIGTILILADSPYCWGLPRPVEDVCLAPIGADVEREVSIRCRQPVRLLFPSW